MSDFYRKSTHTLYIPETVLHEMRSVAVYSPDKEICGLLTGSFEQAICVEKFMEIENVSTGVLTNDDYVMHPQVSMDILKNTQIIPHGPHLYDLVGIYHSHPNGTSFPSKIDIKYAAYCVPYIIYSNLYDVFGFYYWDGNYFIPIDVGVI